MNSIKMFFLSTRNSYSYIFYQDFRYKMVKMLFLCESRLIVKIVKIKISEYQRDFLQIPIRLASTFAPRAILVITTPARPRPSSRDTLLYRFI